MDSHPRTSSCATFLLRARLTASHAWQRLSSLLPSGQRHPYRHTHISFAEEAAKLKPIDISLANAASGSLYFTGLSSSPNLSAPPPLSHPSHSPTSKHRLLHSLLTLQSYFPDTASSIDAGAALGTVTEGGRRTPTRTTTSDCKEVPPILAPPYSPLRSASSNDERILTHVNRIFDDGTVYRVEQHDRHQHVLELARRPSVVHKRHITGNSARYAPSRQTQRPSSRPSGLA